MERNYEAEKNIAMVREAQRPLSKADLVLLAEIRDEYVEDDKYGEYLALTKGLYTDADLLAVELEPDEKLEPWDIFRLLTHAIEEFQDSRGITLFSDAGRLNRFWLRRFHMNDEYSYYLYAPDDKQKFNIDITDEDDL